MNIVEAIYILNKEKSLGRTPNGRALSDYAKKTVDTTLKDNKNHHMNVLKCLGCGFVVSSLLVADGCPNCGAIDLTENIL